MTTLQHRSQGDPEDPHDEQYLLATQSKQEQVCGNSGWEEIVLCLREKFAHASWIVAMTAVWQYGKANTTFRTIDEVYI